jgi:hypothetical protein
VRPAPLPPGMRTASALHQRPLRRPALPAAPLRPAPARARAGHARFQQDAPHAGPREDESLLLQQVPQVREVGPSVVPRGPGQHLRADLRGEGVPGRPAPLAVRQRRPPSGRYAASSRRTWRTETANAVAASVAVISSRSIRWSTSTRFCSRVLNVTLSFILTG